MMHSTDSRRPSKAHSSKASGSVLLTILMALLFCLPVLAEDEDEEVDPNPNGLTASQPISNENDSNGSANSDRDQRSDSEQDDSTQRDFFCWGPGCQ